MIRPQRVVSHKVTVTLRTTSDPGNIETETKHTLWVGALNSGIALLKVGAALDINFDDVTEIEMETNLYE
jgi:hypothetical protein